MHDNSIADAISDLLSPAAARTDTGELDRELWDLVVAAGFDTALVPASLGGSGLSLRDARPILEACGRYAAPLPLSEAMLAHGIAGAYGALLPDGVMTLAQAERIGEHVLARSVPWGRGADWVLALLPAQACLLATSLATCEASAGFGAAGECDLLWRLADAREVIMLPPGFDALATGAALRCAQIAGALDAVLDVSQRYVAERRQFGRRLAEFQAIQQHMAVLAEDVFAAHMAAEIACDTAETFPARASVAHAKVVASEAASRACSIAHAVHGAMGLTAEYPLQRYTRRLRAWRVQYGSEHYWSAYVGETLLARDSTTWEFVLT